MPDLDELERLLSEATPGDWHQGPYYRADIHAQGYGESGSLAVCGSSMIPQNVSNAALIVALHNHAPALIAQAREAARLRDALVEIDILLAPQIDERDLEQAREVARAALDPNRSE
jgi:hypothetical protein